MTQENVIAVKASIAAVLGAFTALWGWFGWLVLGWVLLMAVDWVLGSAIAMKDGEWSSATAREGAWHKAGEMMVVGVAIMMDGLIGSVIENVPNITLPFEYSVMLAALVLIWYVVDELGSILEHAVAVGAPVPSWMVKILELSKTAVDAAGGNIVNEEGDSDDSE